MNPSMLRNLTLASAKHLVSQGHITPAHHKKITAAVKVKAPAMAPNKPPQMPKPMGGKMGAPPMTQQQLSQPVPMGALDASPSQQQPVSQPSLYQD